MTLAQFVTYLRTRLNAGNDSFWSDVNDFYPLITARCNEVLSIIGLQEATDTTQSSTAAQQAYPFPSDAITIKKVLYNGYPLEEISFREWDSDKAGNTTPSSRPRYWVQWNRQILFVPIPDTSSEGLTIYYEKEHAYIDGSTQTTIDLPAHLHFRIADGVLADCFAKDLNMNMAEYFEGLWEKKHIPAFFRYKDQMHYRGKAPTIQNADSLVITDHGLA